MGSCPSSPQPGVREPRENRGRLRHCNGLQTPKATGSAKRNWEGGSEVQAPSQDIGLAVLVAVPPSGTNFSVKRRMRPARLACASWDSLNAFILRFAGVWRFFIFRPRAGLSIINRFGQCAGTIERSAMLKVHLSALALASSILAFTAHAQFAGTV